jgi:hypothetical protein
MDWNNSFKVIPFVQLDEGESGEAVVTFKYVLLLTLYDQNNLNCMNMNLKDQAAPLCIKITWNKKQHAAVPIHPSLP